MNVRLAAASVVLAGLGAAAQSSDLDLVTQPVMTLDGDATVLALHPDHGAVLVVGFTRESNPEAQAWSQRLQSALGAPAASDIPFYNIIMLAGAPRLVRGLIRRGIRSGVPEEQHGLYYIVDQDAEFWLAFATVDDEDRVHVLRVDPRGRPCKRHVGAVTDDALAGMLEAACPAAGGAS